MSSLGAFDFTNTLGAVFVGGLISIALYGITVLQAYLYFLWYPKDSVGLKLVVTAVFILDTLHAVCTSHALYFYMVTNYLNPLALIDETWSVYAATLLKAITSVIIQCYFVTRIHALMLMKPAWDKWKWPVLGTLALSILGHLITGVASLTRLYIARTLTTFRNYTNWTWSYVTLAVVSDAAIAILLCILLGNSKTSFRKTNAMINTLMIYAINRCILSSGIALGESILFVASPGTFWYICLDLILAKVYVNSMLAVCNGRHSVQEKADRGDGTVTIELSGTQPSSGWSSDRRTSRRGPPSIVKTPDPERDPITFVKNQDPDVESVDDEGLHRTYTRPIP